MRNVWTFFYGSFMSSAVLGQAGVHPRERQMAYLDGWELRISPRATLTPAQGSRVYGILGQLTHAEIDKLYTKDWFGFGVYLPEAVMVINSAAAQTPALCYIAWTVAGGKPSPEYIGKMVSVAREYSFPAEYVRHIESFA